MSRLNSIWSRFDVPVVNLAVVGITSFSFEEAAKLVLLVGSAAWTLYRLVRQWKIDHGQPPTGETRRVPKNCPYRNDPEKCPLFPGGGLS